MNKSKENSPRNSNATNIQNIEKLRTSFFNKSQYSSDSMRYSSCYLPPYSSFTKDKTSRRQLIVKHPTIKPPKYFFSNVKNQYLVENKVKANKYYVPLTSFEEKFNNELKRISNKYGKVDSRQRFYPNKNLEIFWDRINDFEKYQEMKEIEDRYTKFLKNPRPRLKPLNCPQRSSLDKLARNLFNFDKINKRNNKLKKY